MDGVIIAAAAVARSLSAKIQNPATPYHWSTRTILLWHINYSVSPRKYCIASCQSVKLDTPRREI